METPYQPKIPHQIPLEIAQQSQQPIPVQKHVQRQVYTPPPKIQYVYPPAEDSFFDKVSKYRWSIMYATIYGVLFYILTSPQIIEFTSTYIPSFISKRMAHSILFGLIYLVFNLKKYD